MPECDLDRAVADVEVGQNPPRAVRRHDAGGNFLTLMRKNALKRRQMPAVGQPLLRETALVLELLLHVCQPRTVGYHRVLLLLFSVFIGVSGALSHHSSALVAVPLPGWRVPLGAATGRPQERHGNDTKTMPTLPASDIIATGRPRERYEKYAGKVQSDHLVVPSLAT